MSWMARALMFVMLFGAVPSGSGMLLRVLG
jgi:hypothetical protein